MYWASKGQGAFLNETKIHVLDKEPIYRIVGINISGASPELVQRLQPVFKSHNHTRHFGANALEMAMFARGLIDIFIDLRDKIRIQDMAAGYLLIKEAGGLMLDANLQPLDSDLSYEARLSFIAAANQKILNEIMSQIGK
jgi:myo-inositol-1(or 4)-monophosphatase